MWTGVRKGVTNLSVFPIWFLNALRTEASTLIYINLMALQRNRAQLMKIRLSVLICFHFVNLHGNERNKKVEGKPVTTTLCIFN